MQARPHVRKRLNINCVFGTFIIFGFTFEEYILIMKNTKFTFAGVTNLKKAYQYL